MVRGVILILVLFCAGLSAALADDSITITTYYPSPYGNYREMRVNQMSVGSVYNNYSSYPLNDGNLIVSGNVGVGTAAPSARLEVAGQIKITGGTPGAGKVLTSDAAGLASWQASSPGTVVYSCPVLGANVVYSGCVGQLQTSPTCTYDLPGCGGCGTGTCTAVGRISDL